MKARQLNIFFFVCFLGILILGCGKKGPLSKNDALWVAENTPEVKSLYALSGGKLKKCVEPEVVKPCETDWVTCVEDAWVVVFSVTEACGIKHDGRLNVTFLVDALNGNIKSRYPEAQYFQQKEYCQTDSECFVGNGECRNFIFGQMEEGFVNNGTCKCVKNVCKILE